MADIDNLTDSELRAKLTEYGFPIMPITGTTRKIMIKKLKILMENKSKSSVDGRRSLGRYSSEDDSDSEVKSRAKTRRQTMGVTPMQPPKATPKKVTKIIETVIEDEAPKEKKTRSSVTTTTTKTRMVRSSRDEFDTGSDSESEIVSNSHLGDNLRSSPVGGGYLSSLTSRGSPKKTPEVAFSRSFTSASPRTATPYNSPALSSNYAADRLNQIRSRLSLGNTYDKGYSSTLQDDNTEAAEPPFLSNFTKRLSQISKTDYDSKADIKEHDSNGATLYPRHTYSTSTFRSTRPRDYATSYDYKSSQSNVLKNNLVPFAVLAVAFLFFIFVAIMYLGIRSTNVAAPEDFNVPFCDSHNHNNKKWINCILEEEKSDALALYQVLKPELTRRAIDKACGDTTSQHYMTDGDIIAFLKDHRVTQTDYKIKADTRNLQIIVLSNRNNPNMRLSLIHLPDDNGDLSDNILDNLDSIGFENMAKTIALVDLHPELPWTCSLYRKVLLLVKTVIFGGVCFGVLYLTNLGYKYYKFWTQNRRIEVVSMVERILELLENNAAESSENNYLVINHVRDVLIPVNERKSKEKIWKEAVQFINENESRVRTEIQIVQGEEYHVWRWVGSANLSIGGSPRSNKTWQGQAFETQVGSVNSPPCPPSPCLKIRGIVEDGDRNVELIKDTVLSKCADLCRILHIAVDTEMKCVYMKCAETTDAAIAFRNLHGWWCNGQLVTVKYLRLERYMQRYPDSPTRGPYLKASKPSSDWAS